MSTRHGDSAALIKLTIKRIVTAYKFMNAEDYKLTRKAVEMKRKLLKDPKFGEGDGDMRALFEISETLSTALIRGLDTEASNWFKTKEGARWFANTFGEFSLAEKYMNDWHEVEPHDKRFAKYFTYWQQKEGAVTYGARRIKPEYQGKIPSDLLHKRIEVIEAHINSL